ncbi:DeoR/GlpR family DNA-binding transcription regulator [Enterococcus pingfangensis]|uniref:DeoR/GlpR family DNA-binding transcription regulator n=1 Tax=Enterococcus pingfangensis TaxID=2559924 RepID=UPI0010F4E74C|nr:DeoR/GlpR family DNA-binding transcription regulator [Enterococcus pingfangensis]
MKSRQEAILNLIKRKKYISVAYLVEKFHYSESTIRRDLTTLEKLNLIKRTAGGAILVKDDLIEPPHLVKYKTNIEEKRLIAELALDFIEDYSTIFLDASSTCHFLAKKINKSRENIKIITPSLVTALEINSSSRNSVYCVGGLVADGKVGGPLSEFLLSELHVDFSFISCRGFDRSFGASDILETEAGIKKTILKNSEKIALLFDHSKFNKRYTFQTASIHEIDFVITDRKPSREVISNEDEMNYELVYWNE